MANDLLIFNDRGIYCPRSNVYIDPIKPVDKAILTHAHSDHARPGSKYYIAQKDNFNILKLRLGDIPLETKAYNERFLINQVKFSFHPAGHIWGSSQVRVEYKDEVWVVSGDYKTVDDGFSTPYEPIKCHVFISESTFALPVFKWLPQKLVLNQLELWWKKNAEDGKTSIVSAYALGKAQRLLTSVNPDIGKIFVHGAVHNVNEALRKDGAILPDCQYVSPEIPKSAYPGSLVVTPSSGLGTSWVNKFYPYELGTVSGWMNIRGIKRRRNAGRGFVLSDHADWQGLNQAVEACEAEKIFVMHGYTDSFARYLNGKGLESDIVKFPGSKTIGNVETLSP